MKHQMLKPELIEYLRSHGAKITGLKPELLQRALDYKENHLFLKSGMCVRYLSVNQYLKKRTRLTEIANIFRSLPS